MNPLSVKTWAEREFGALNGLIQGIAVATVIGITALFLSEHYGAPAMLMALLLGIACHFLAEEGPWVAGINFTARTVLRMGVALLGARISVELLIGLGVELIGLVILGVVATIAFAWLGAKFLGCGWRFALLTGGALGIDRSGDGEICPEDSVSVWDNWAASRMWCLSGGRPASRSLPKVGPQHRRSVCDRQGTVSPGGQMGFTGVSVSSPWSTRAAVSGLPGS